jgi:hypothetical protein
MDGETWFTSEEATAAGFVDSVDADEEDDTLAAVAAFDLSVYAHVPDTLVARVGERAPDMRELEQTLCDAGLSRIAARAMVSQWDADRPWRAGPPVGSQCDADLANEEQAPSRLARARHELLYSESLAIIANAIERRSA